ncbi:MAG: ribonuclease R family protein, partial [Trichlorobacter sp.]
MIERADILSLLKRESESLPYAAILRALGGRPANRELKRLLEGLVRDGEVVRSRGNRYTLAGASTTGTITGTLSLHRDGYGFVRVGDGSEDVFVPAKAIGSAMHGDTVTVKAERSRYQGQQRREGRITTIVTRAHASMVGRIQFTSRGALLIPEDQRVATPVIITAGSVQAAVDGQQVVVAITRWPVGGRPAEGRITEILGWPDDPDVEVMTVIHSHNLPFSFSDSQLREAELVPDQISRDDLRDRVDLRKRLTVTIDGETARDFDDAVSIAREGDHYRLWVSIADVSHYVRPGSELDREALVRGTSVYFPDRCIPMLPERLSNGICSLNPAVDRLTMTAEMLFDQTGTMIDQQFYPSVITSDARLTYTIVKELVVDGLDRSFHDKREVIPSL